MVGIPLWARDFPLFQNVHIGCGVHQIPVYCVPYGPAVNHTPVCRDEFNAWNCTTYYTAYLPYPIHRRGLHKENCAFKTGKVRPRIGHERPEGEQTCSSTLSLTSALDGCG